MESSNYLYTWERINAVGERAQPLWICMGTEAVLVMTCMITPGSVQLKFYLSKPECLDFILSILVKLLSVGIPACFVAPSTPSFQGVVLALGPLSAYPQAPPSPPHSSCPSAKQAQLFSLALPRASSHLTAAGRQQGKVRHLCPPHELQDLGTWVPGPYSCTPSVMCRGCAWVHIH